METDDRMERRIIQFLLGRAAQTRQHRHNCEGPITKIDTNKYEQRHSSDSLWGDDEGIQRLEH